MQLLRWRECAYTGLHQIQAKQFAHLDVVSRDGNMPSPSLLLLQRVGLFSALSEDDLEVLATSLRLRRYGRDEVICHREDPGDSLFIIEDGSVKIGLTSPDAREVILTQMNKGDFFGEMALLDGQPRSAMSLR